MCELAQSVVSEGRERGETKEKRGSRLGLGEPARPQPRQRSQSSAVAEDFSTDYRPYPNLIERAYISTERRPSGELLCSRNLRFMA